MDTLLGTTSKFSRLQDYLTHLNAVMPTNDAMVFGDERWSYAELQDAVEQIASTMVALGVCRGDRIAMLTSPRPEFWVIFLATTSIGAVWVGINPKYRMNEIKHLLDSSKPKLVFVMGEGEIGQLDNTSLHSIADVLIERFIVLDAAEEAATNIAKLSAMKTVRNHTNLEWAVEDEDAAAIVYTSGTTGRPKGAILSHIGLAEGSDIQANHFDVPLPRIICNLPVNHVGCIADICATTLVRGGCIIFQEAFDPGKVLETIESEKVSVLGGVPTMFIALLEHECFARTDFSSVELIIWGGAAMPRNAVEQLAHLGARLKTAYGMTETSCHVAFTADNASENELCKTVGMPVNEIECRIVDPASELPIGREETGELQFRGKTNFIGYFGDNIATTEAFTRDGWLKTGDLARFNSIGGIELVGRLKEMFKSGGYNVYPREVEMALEFHWSVLQAAVVGVPDNVYQEVGAAFVLLERGANTTPEALTKYLKATIANYKVPKTLFVCDALPMLSIGKVDKSALRAKALSVKSKE